MNHNTTRRSLILVAIRWTTFSHSEQNVWPRRVFQSSIGTGYPSVRRSTLIGGRVALESFFNPLKGIVMLVLSRKLNESIHVGDQVVIRIIQVRGGKVRVGIEAPREIEVVRSELRNPPTDEEPQAKAA